MTATKKSIAIIQSCYIPWRGFFDFIDSVDEYYILDDAQYVKRHWHNRNKIKTPNGPIWLSIPVDTKGKFTQSIDETLISDPLWAEKHWQTIRQNYAKAPFFKDYENDYQETYEKAARISDLSSVNELFFKKIMNDLGIDTKIFWARDFGDPGVKTERLLSVAKAAGAGHYISGPSARDYLQTDMFTDEGIDVSYMNYAGYPEYPQLWGNFEPAVSTLDLIFNTGPEAKKYMNRNQPRWTKP